jgi:hypothetical protein
MRLDIETQPQYEDIVCISSLLLIKAMRLFHEFGELAANNPGFFRNARVQKGLADIVQAMDICGTWFERLPVPPVGTEEADLCFRALGKEIRGFAGYLSALTAGRQGPGKRRTWRETAAPADAVKHNYRAAIEAFEQVYPGRLSRALKGEKV